MTPAQRIAALRDHLFDALEAPARLLTRGPVKAAIRELDPLEQQLVELVEELAMYQRLHTEAAAERDMLREQLRPASVVKGLRDLAEREVGHD